MPPFRRIANHMTRFLLIALLPISYITNAQPDFYNSSKVAVVCQDADRSNPSNLSIPYVYRSYDISDAAALETTTISGVTVPISATHPDLTNGLTVTFCYLYVLLDDDGPSVFDVESECTLSIQLEEQTQAPSMDPTNDPTNNPSPQPTSPTYEPTTEPTMDPTKDPTNDPTQDPTKDPTGDPTAPTTPTTPTTAAPTTAAPTTSAPTTDSPTTAAPTTSDPTTAAPTTAAPTTAAPTTDAPTTATPTTAVPTTDAPTEPETAFPTSLDPTSDPTSDPTMEPTKESVIIDLDEIAMMNIFNVNNKNLVWINDLRGVLNSTSTNNYTFIIHPGCGDGGINATLGDSNITTFLLNNSALYQPAIIYGLLSPIGTKESNDSFTRVGYDIPNQGFETPLFPTQFTVTTYDTEEESSFSFAISGDTSPDITCSYGEAFETEADDDNTTTSKGIEYIFLPVTNQGGELIGSNDERLELILDVIITRSCVEDTTTTTDFPFTTSFTSTEEDDDDDDTLLGLQLEVVIAMAVVLAVIILAVIITVICLVRRRSMFEDIENDDEILKGPKEHTELATAHTPFTVTERDHAEMLELQARNSLSTGLEAD